MELWQGYRVINSQVSYHTVQEQTEIPKGKLNGQAFDYTSTVVWQLNK